MLWEKEHRRRRRSSHGLPRTLVVTIVVVALVLLGLLWAVWEATG
jgi:hypothetical protein